MSTAIAFIDTLDGIRLNRALRAGILRLLSRQEHLNKINVFPVADGDTGTNLAVTMGAVFGTLQRWQDTHAGKTLTRVADAALDGARGNSGAILAQFFLGLCDRLGHLRQLSPEDFAAGVRGGADYARESLSEPREGTILTVLTDFAHELQGLSARERIADFSALLRRGLRAAQHSLERTKFQLEVLRRANVVDAGAEGFVELLSGMSEYLESGRDDDPALAAELPVSAALEETAGQEEALAHRYCTECIVVGEDIDRRRLRERLSAIGSSLVVAGLRSKVRVHVHVNDPAEVFRIVAGFGAVSGEKADDMQRQQHSAHATRHRVAIVTDSAADVPEDDLDRLDIHVVPLRVHFGERSYLDKVGIAPEEFFRELERNPAHPKSSQPPPGDFRRQFEFLGSHYDAVVSINLSRHVSGTLAAAKTAASRTTTHGHVTVVDSLNVSVGQGLLVAYAAECAQAGRSAEEVLAATRAMIPRTRSFGLAGSLEYAVRGGRLPRWVQRVADALRLMPVLHTTPEGEVKPRGALFGRRRLREKFARHVLREMEPSKRYRIVVGHANCETDGRWLLEALAGERVVSAKLMPLGSVLGVHGGPGMLVVGVQEWESPR